MRRKIFVLEIVVENEDTPGGYYEQTSIGGTEEEAYRNLYKETIGGNCPCKGKGSELLDKVLKLLTEENFPIHRSSLTTRIVNFKGKK